VRSNRRPRAEARVPAPSRRLEVRVGFGDKVAEHLGHEALPLPLDVLITRSRFRRRMTGTRQRPPNCVVLAL